MQMPDDIGGVNFPQRTTRKMAAKMRQFRTAEDGTMVIFSLFMFMAMLMVAGLGIDLMRYERDRSRLQATLDRAVLAAADLDQERDASDVVNDYFSKSGINGRITSIVPTSGIGYKTVYAAAKVELGTTFLTMVGIDSLTAAADSMAEERIDGVEISLVLDISGSMASNSRLSRLKPAAKDFVTSVIGASENGKVSVSIIPYATQVSAGESLLSQYTVSDEHTYSNCVNFNANEYQSSSLSMEDELERTGHFDIFTYSENPISRPVCPVADFAHILPLGNDETVLHAKIDSLEAGGNTSIDIGVKWGTTLLDPETQPAVTALINAGEIASSFASRPLAYDDTSTIKVMVVMSDGQNTNQYMLNPSLRDGMSDVWYNAEADRYSVQRSQGRRTEYWWPYNRDWYDHPFGNTETNSHQTETGTAVRLSYPELWSRTSMAWNAEYNYGFQRNRWTEWYNNAYTYKNATAKDQQTKHICNAAKDQGIIVFTVGFEAPRNGQAVLQDCASSDSHHFDVDGLEIEDAFAAIAASIRQLRLTQ